MIDASKYTIAVKAVDVDGESCFQAQVKELPDVCEYADTYSEAYELAIDTIETTAEMLSEIGKKMPDPICEESHGYSGRVTLRVAKQLHRSLAEEAKREEVSLNGYINYLICSNHSEVATARKISETLQMHYFISDISSFQFNDQSITDLDHWGCVWPEAADRLLPEIPAHQIQEIQRIV